MEDQTTLPRVHTRLEPSDRMLPGPVVCYRTGTGTGTGTRPAVPDTICNDTEQILDRPYVAVVNNSTGRHDVT